MTTDANSASDAVSCRACGTTNDRFYTYCRHCLRTLP
ncbi:DUF7577 domain-containing protein [Natrarchaeobius oligotrophus]